MTFIGKTLQKYFLTKRSSANLANGFYREINLRLEYSNGDYSEIGIIRGVNKPLEKLLPESLIFSLFWTIKKRC